jgi:hypothetical protein
MRWIYSKNTAQWEMTFGGWRASVRSWNVRGTWHATIRRPYPPYRTHGQADFGWPSSARAWCEEEIMRLRWRGADLDPTSTATDRSDVT